MQNLLNISLCYIDDERLSPVGQAGAEIFSCPDDYISINGIRLCGEKLNDASIIKDFSQNAPVTDYHSGPITIPVVTNNKLVSVGFKLMYMQSPCQLIPEFDKIH